MLTRFAPRVCICQVVLAGCRTDFDDLKKRRLSIISESSFFISTSFCDSYHFFESDDTSTLNKITYEQWNAQKKIYLMPYFVPSQVIAFVNGEFGALA